jgi:xylulokinase
MARALLESTCFEIRKSVELLGEFGLAPASVLVSGGASRSATWMQILADILGVRVDVPAESDCAAFGAAILAGTGAGMFAGAEEAAGKLTATKMSYAPNESLRKQYDDAYKKNLALYEATAKSR